MWSRLKQFFWQWRGVLFIVPTVAGAVTGLHLTGALQTIEFAVFDQFFRLRPSGAVDPRIVIIEITEADIQKLGYPISDEQLAKLLTTLNQAQPRVIGLDLFRDLPVEPGNPALVKLFQTTPNVIGIRKVVPNAAGLAVNAPAELQKRGQVAANDLVIDPDGKVRRVLLSLKDREQKTVPSLGVDLALRYLKAEGIQPKVIDAKKSDIQLGKATFRPLKSDDGGYTHIDVGGYQLLSNFHSLRQGFERISLAQILAGQVPVDRLRDRIVLIGVTAESVGDLFLTPYSTEWFRSFPTQYSGVSIHADVASQILSAALDGQVYFRFVPNSIEFGWTALWAAIGAALCWHHRYRQVSSNSKSRRLIAKIPLIAIAIVLLSGVLLGVSYLAFIGGWWIPVIPALLALNGSSLVVTGYVARMTAGMRQTFGRYLADEVVANLLETPEGLKLGGECRQVTILVSDLRGFSSISERVAPQKVLETLNLYLQEMTQVINEYKGLISEFVGDGIFVIFGAPIQREDDTQRAIACALSMQLAMQRVNQQLADLGLPGLEMGIAIHTGEAITGNIGSQQRAKYAVLGSNVNLAFRIESYTVGGQILISREVLREVGSILRIDGEMQVSPKGFQEAITLYEIGGIAGDFNISLPRSEESLVPLEQKIDVQFLLVQEKHLMKEFFSGSITKLSENTAEIHSSCPVPLLANLQLNLVVEAEKARGLGDIYAKVIETSDNLTIFRIRFTAVPPEINALFHYLRQLGKEDL